MQPIQLKRGRLADLLALDPIPAEGEIILDLDSGNFKIGDGLQNWSALPYANVSVSALTASQIGDFETAAAAVAASAFSAKRIGELFDVSSTTPNAGDVLTFSAGAWGPIAATALVSQLWVAPPESANAAGAPGQLAYDGNYIYICVAESVWVRAALGTW